MATSRSARHSRQRRLVEVGDDGQARIAAARARVPGGGLAAEVAGRYLAGAGVGTLEVEDVTVEAAVRAVDPAVGVVLVNPRPGGAARAEAAPSASEEGVADPAARELLAGALFALRVLSDAVFSTAVAPDPADGADVTPSSRTYA